MTLPRNQLISIEDTPYYHIITRCVRRAFLCGKDKYSGKCFEHRRQLIVNRIKQLADVFNIIIYILVNPPSDCLRHSNLILPNLVIYAICFLVIDKSSNHYHLVLKVNSTQDRDEKFFWKEFSRKPSWMKVKLRDELNKKEC